MKAKKIRISDYKPVTVLNPYSLEQDKVLKAKIKQAIKSIRRKYLALKLAKVEENETLNRLLNPIIKPLKELKLVQNHSKHTNQNNKLKYKLKQEKDEDEEEWEDSVEDNRKDEGEEEFKDAVEEPYTSETFQKPVDTYLKQYPSLAKHYIEGYFNKQTSKDYDKTYGVKFDLQTNKLYLGNKELKIDQHSQIIIDNEIYDSSEGLYNLLFLKHPKDYTKRDLTDYKEILELTSAHKRNYDPLEQFKGTNALKYTKIINPLFNVKKNKKIFDTRLMDQEPETMVLQPIDSPSASTSGADMNLACNNKPFGPIYWDDVNELVDRLRILNSLKLVKNTDSYDNEVLAIENELREAGIIA